ncbi:MAG: hypothetical protein L6R42_004204, partial [Xanthoria sp. 1 TBL-2021]
MDLFEYRDWFWSWFRDSLMSCRTYDLSKSHSSFVRANPHLTQANWASLNNRIWPPAGIPVFAPFAVTGGAGEGYYVQIRPGKAKRGVQPPKRRLHRLACATVTGHLTEFRNDTGLQASHRLITFAGMERDFNGNNLVPES